MLKPKYRNIIPNESEEKKNKDKSAYCEIYDIGGMNNKVQLVIKSLYTEKSNFEIHGNFLYQIKNCSHFEIESELDFSKSAHCRTQEKNTFEPNKKLFTSHIEPFQDLNKSVVKEKSKKEEEEEDGICKVQYNKSYKIKTKIKLAFTFPSLEKQLSFVEKDHKEIEENLEYWKQFEPAEIEQFLIFYNFNKKSLKSFEKLRKFVDLPNKESNDNSKKNNIYMSNKMSNYNNSIQDNNDNNSNNNSSNEKLYFVDRSFPPCQVKYKTIDLNKISMNSKMSTTEQNQDKKKEIVFHYRGIESLLPDHKDIFNKNEVDPYDIKYGLFKNKKIISVFAHLADYPSLLSKLFVENTINSFGIYKIKLFYQNIWTDIYIDKFIPCFPCYFPLYTYSPTSLWPCVLEKALAKIFRGYDNLKYISFYELYEILTGFPIINFKRINDHIDKNTFIKMFDNFNNKNLNELSNYTSNFKFVVNSKYNNIAVETVNKNDIIAKYLFYNNNDNNPINNMQNNNKRESISNLFKNIEEEYIQQNKINYKNSYLTAFYASNSYLKYLLEIDKFPIYRKKIKSLQNKIFPVKFANDKKVVIKSIYNYQLKQIFYNYFSEDIIITNSLQNDSNGMINNIKSHLQRETETLTLTWDMLFVLFDNVIIIKSNNYKELHFRNGFVRCMDVKSPDYDRILAHTYYELHIKKSKTDIEAVRMKEEIKDKKAGNNDGKKQGSHGENKKKEKIKCKSMNVNLDTINFFNKINDNNKNNNIKNANESKCKDLIPVTIVLNLSNDHFLDNSYYSPEIDFKIGVLKLNKKKEVNQKDPNNNINKKDINDPFYGLNPVLVTCPDFQIGYSLVYDLYLEEGKYIIVPMTMGYCMQKSEKIKCSYYSLRDDDEVPLSIKKTVIPRFLDDIFYLNDPFGHNYLEYKVINAISKNLLDNKGRKIKEIDENSLYNIFSRIGECKKIEKFGLSKLSFKEFIFDKMTLLNELQKKQCMRNLGYEDNTYPYLSRFFGISFYFGKFKRHNDNDILTIIPKNNLVDTNMDSIVNIRTLEKNLSKLKNIEYGQPKRISFSDQSGDRWYTIEGVFMSKNKGNKSDNEKKSFDFDKSVYDGENVFYSTNNSNITAMVHPGKWKFLLYVVTDILNSGKDQKESNNNGQSSSKDDRENENEKEEKESESSEEEEDNTGKDIEDSNMYSNKSKASSEEN